MHVLTSVKRYPRLGLILLAFIAFIALGLPDGLLGMAATGLGTVVIPATMGVLARRVSLEIIPVYLLAVYVGLAGVYLLATRPRQAQAVTVPA